MTDNNVVLFNKQSSVDPCKPIPEIIEELEFLLREAQAGNLRALAIVGLNGPLYLTWSYVHSANSFALVGGIEILKLGVLTAIMGQEQ